MEGWTGKWWRKWAKFGTKENDVRLTVCHDLRPYFSKDRTSSKEKKLEVRNEEMKHVEWILKKNDERMSGLQTR